MTWLNAMGISALIIFLVGAVVVGITFLIMWAEERERDLEMFVAIVIVITWIVFALVLHKVG